MPSRLVILASYFGTSELRDELLVPAVAVGPDSFLLRLTAAVRAALPMNGEAVLINKGRLRRGGSVTD